MSVICNFGSQRYLRFNFKSKHNTSLTINRFFIVIHISILLISCNLNSKNSTKEIIRFNSATGITSLDPAYARTQENIRAVNQVFSGLVKLNDQLNVVPSIAKKWSISEDAKTYTFVLNSGVFFHNHPVFKMQKREVISSDFEYSFKRILDPSTASDGAWIFNGIIDQSQPFNSINDTIFQIKLNKPFAPFLNMLTMAYCYVVPREIVELYGDEFGKKPIGTGPFMFANWANGIKLNMIRNPNYFESTQQNSIPKLDGISISFIQSKQTELLEFIQGNLDLFTGLESSFKDEILTNGGTLNAKYLEDFEIQISPFLNTEYLAFNMEDESSPIHDLNYRKAIHHCINREAMINYLRNGIGTPANGGFIPIGLPGHVNYDNSSFDIDLARKYIQKSNANKNQPITLTTTSNYLDLCILVQKNCAEIGIEVKIDVVPSSLLKQQKSAGDLTFFRSSWIADYPDGENFMACFYGPNKAPNGPNYSRYSNIQFDQNYNELIACTDNSIKKKLFKKMENTLHEDQPFILLFYDESIWIKNKKIKQINVNALNHLDLRFTDFKS